MSSLNGSIFLSLLLKFPYPSLIHVRDAMQVTGLQEQFVGIGYFSLGGRPLSERDLRILIGL